MTNIVMASNFHQALSPPANKFAVMKYAYNGTDERLGLPDIGRSETVLLHTLRRKK